MALALDHVFVCTSAGAPEAEALAAAGLTEGPGNVHPGQGTACRRFFFRNAYLELLWVHDEAQARSPTTAPLRLWERWRGRADGHTCPFGIGLRPGDGAAEGDAHGVTAPFPAWPYRPPHLPPGMVMPVATNSEALDEPLLFVLPFHPPFHRPHGAAGGAAPWRVHPSGVQAVTRVALAAPAAAPSAALRAVVAAGVVERVAAAEHAVIVGFDGEAAGRNRDLRPTLPLILRW
jgi:hypothetical protein